MSRADPKRTPGRAMKRQSKAGRPAPVALPMAPRTVWKLLIGGFALLATSAALVWAVAAKLPQQATLAVATASSSAGFVIRQVNIEGATHQPKLSIYREVLEGGSDSMLLADLPAMRARLVALPWVRDASIQRRWPDRLEIRIVERKPAAVWQHRGRLKLIDAEGAVLPAGDLAPYALLPLLVGPHADRQAAALLKLVATQPQLAGELRAAIWVGDRRWDLRMKSGETIALPEGPAAEAALMRFAEIHRDTPLLGRGFVRFDLRIPDKMVVRVSDSAGATKAPGPPRPATPAARAPQQAPAAQVVARAPQASKEVVI
jgi:cell division protein FtsQ